MAPLPCWQMDGVLSEAGVSHVLGINRCGAGSSGADPGARGWDWRHVHWEKPARGRVGGNRFPQELGTNLAPWGGGKQPLAPLPPAPSGGNYAEVPNPSPQSVLCSQGSRRWSRHRDLGIMRDVLGGTLWDSPAREQVLGWGRDGAGGPLSTAEPKRSSQNHPVHVCGCGTVLENLFALVGGGLVTPSSSPLNLLCCTFPWVPSAQVLLGVPWAGFQGAACLREGTAGAGMFVSPSKTQHNPLAPVSLQLGACVLGPRGG